MQNQELNPVNSSDLQISFQPVGCRHKTTFGQVGPKKLTKS